MSDNLLKIKDLHVMYRTDDANIYAVNGVDLSLQKGKTLGLVGETGAGKTTLALSVMRLLPDNVGFVTGGSITFDEFEVMKLSEQDMRLLRGKDISMIFQDPMTSLNPIKTVGSQIDEVLELHHPEQSATERARQVDRMMEMVGIPANRKGEYPHQFSGGMKQRIVIAIALACNPKLLLADEPTTALDVTIQAQVLTMMNRLKSQLGTSMILITHDLGIVAQICDEVAIMYAGEIVEKGTVEDIFEGTVHHPYTVGLFGAIPNLKEKTRRLHPIEGLMPDPATLPQGCYFADRCEHCTVRCRSESPQMLRVGETHRVKCHLFCNQSGV